MAENRYIFLKHQRTWVVSRTTLCSPKSTPERSPMVITVSTTKLGSWDGCNQSCFVCFAIQEFTVPCITAFKFFYSEFVSCSANPHISFLIFKAHRVLFYPLSCSYFKRCWCLVRVFRKSQLFFTVTLGAWNGAGGEGEQLGVGGMF